MMGIRDYTVGDNTGQPIINNSSNTLNPNVTERKVSALLLSVGELCFSS